MPGTGSSIKMPLQFNCVDIKALAVAYTFLNLSRICSLSAELGALPYITFGAWLFLKLLWHEAGLKNIRCVSIVCDAEHGLLN